MPDFSSFSDEELVFVFDAIDIASPNLGKMKPGVYVSVFYKGGTPRPLWESADEVAFVRALLAEMAERGCGDAAERLALASALAADTVVEVQARAAAPRNTHRHLPVIRR